MTKMLTSQELKFAEADLANPRAILSAGVKDLLPVAVAANTVKPAVASSQLKLA